MDEEIFEVEEYVVHFYTAEERIITMITEARHRGQPLAGKYSVQKHPPHTQPGQHHLHLYAKNNHLFAINKDGTAHDQSHGVRIPNKVADELKKQFPDFSIPLDNMIESADMKLAAILVEIEIERARQK